MSSSAASFDDKRVPASSSEVPQPVTSSGHTVVPPAYHVETQESVLKAEALQRVWFVHPSWSRIQILMKQFNL